MLGDLRVPRTRDDAVRPDSDGGGAGGALVEAQDDFADVGFQVRLRLPVE